MVTHQQHGKGKCDCPKLRTSAWLGPAPTGWQEPILLVLPRSPEAAGGLREIIRHAGLRPGLVFYAEGIMAHLDGHSAVRLAVGLERIGPVRVSPEWTQVARSRGDVVLMLGTMTVLEDMDVDAYLDRYGDEVVTGLVPVAGAATDRRCVATTILPAQPWVLRPSPAGRVAWREAE